MIALKYYNSDNKIMPILLSKKSITGYKISDKTIEINFKVSTPVKEGKEPVTFEWRFNTSIVKVTNFDEVKQFLRSTGNSESKIQTQLNL